MPRDECREVSAERRVPRDECRETSAERRAPRDERRETSAERRVPRDECRETSAERLVPRDERRETSAERRVPRDECRETSAEIDECRETSAEIDECRETSAASATGVLGDALQGGGPKAGLEGGGTSRGGRAGRAQVLGDQRPPTFRMATVLPVMPAPSEASGCSHVCAPRALPMAPFPSPLQPAARLGQHPAGRAARLGQHGALRRAADRARGDSEEHPSGFAGGQALGPAVPRTDRGPAAGAGPRWHVGARMRRRRRAARTSVCQEMYTIHRCTHDAHDAQTRHAHTTSTCRRRFVAPLRPAQEGPARPRMGAGPGGPAGWADAPDAGPSSRPNC